MSETCKHQIKDAKLSTWDNVVYRNCQMKAVNNGYCTRHDPERIEAEVASASQREIIEEIRQAKRKEEAAVGLFLRLRRPEEFAELLSDLQEAEEVNRQVRWL